MLFAKIKNIFINPIVLEFTNSNLSDPGRIHVPKNLHYVIQNLINTKKVSFASRKYYEDQKKISRCLVLIDNN